MDALIATLGIIGTIVVLVAVAVGVLSFLVSLYHFLIIIRYRRFNKEKVECGLTGTQAAEKLVETLNLQGVTVKKVGFWASLIWGNHYNAKTKTIYLRKNIINQNSITAVALASQKVAIAERHASGDKKVRTRQVLSNFGMLAPIVFVPLILIGVVIDVAFIKSNFVCTLVFTCIALAYFITGLVAMSLNIKIEKAACKRALEYFAQTNLLNEEERQDAKLLYKTYITSYIVDYIYEILYVIWLIMKLVRLVLTSKKD